MSYSANKSRILAKVDDYFEDKLAVIGEVVTGSVKPNIPVGVYNDGTVGGRLKSSYSWRTSNESGGLDSHPLQGDDQVSQPKKLVVRIGTNVEYGIFVELGVRGKGTSNRGKGALRNGLNENRAFIKETLQL